MELIPKKLQYDFDDLKINHDLINDANNSIRKSFDNKLEEIITESLKLKGYEFQNKQQLYEFAKRCNVISFTYKKLKELWYEDEFILSWEEFTDYDYSDNKTVCNTTIKYNGKT